VAGTDMTDRYKIFIATEVSHGMKKTGGEAKQSNLANSEILEITTEIRHHKGTGEIIAEIRKS
jgi:hypothetical protein